MKTGFVRVCTNKYKVDTFVTTIAHPQEQNIIGLVRKFPTVEYGNTATYLFSTDYTAQEYFERKGESQFQNAHASIATTCLTYLSFDVFGVG